MLWWINKVVLLCVCVYTHVHADPPCGGQCSMMLPSLSWVSVTDLTVSNAVACCSPSAAAASSELISYLMVEETHVELHVTNTVYRSHQQHRKHQRYRSNFPVQQPNSPFMVNYTTPLALNTMTQFWIDLTRFWPNLMLTRENWHTPVARET